MAPIPANYTDLAEKLSKATGIVWSVGHGHNAVRNLPTYWLECAPAKGTKLFELERSFNNAVAPAMAEWVKSQSSDGVISARSASTLASVSGGVLQISPDAVEFAAENGGQKFWDAMAAIKANFAATEAKERAGPAL